MNITKWLFALGASVSISFVASAFEPNAIEAFEQKNYQQAKTLFKDHKELAEKNYYLGRIAIIENKLDDAEDYLEKAVELKSKNADYHYWFGYLNLRQAANASIFTAPGYASDAREHLSKAVELQPDHLKALRSLVSFYINAPSIAGGSVKKAQALVEKISSVSNEEGLITQLQIYQEEEEKEEELKVAEQLEKNHSDSARALLKAGFSYQGQQQYQAAFRAFEKASKISSEEDKFSPLSALYQIGRTASLSKQEVELGIKAFNQYLTLEIDSNLPSKNWARYRLAILLQTQGKIEKAIENAKLASKDEADNSLRRQAKKLLGELKNMS